MWPRIIAVTTFGLLSCSALYADNCNRVRTVYPTYVAPTAYVAPVYKEQIILVPKAIEVEVHRDHYYSIDSYYQQNLLADAIVGRLMLLNGKSNGPGRPINSVSAPSPDPVKSGPVAASNYQNSDLINTLKASCVKCHDGQQRTAFLTTDDKLLALPKSKVLEIYHLVNTGKMPKSSAPLDDKVMPLIDQWVDNSK